MRHVRADGFDVGLHAYDHVRWQDFAARRDAEWTRRELRRGIDAFGDIFGDAPRVHGAAGWQMNEAAFRLEAAEGFECASDVRGTQPFVPALCGAACPQFPTTLPTLDELIGVDGRTADDAVAELLGSTCVPPQAGHVFTLHAELEGMRLMPQLARLVRGWQAQGYELVSLRTLRRRSAVESLPRHTVLRGRVPGRAGALAMQQAAK